MTTESPKWHLIVDFDQRNLLIDSLRRKVQICRAILKNKWKYGKYTLEKAKKDLEIAESLLKSLGWEEVKEGKVEVKKEKSIEERLKDLEMKLENLEIIVKKLVTYHEGDIK